MTLEFSGHIFEK